MTASASEVTMAGLRVLIVEDEPLLAMCLGEVLEDGGCVVVGTVGRLAEAVARVAAGGFDVAVLDLNLYGESSAPVATALVRGGNGVVFATGSTAAEVPAEFRDWPVLCKPYRDSDVLTALAAARNTQLSERQSVG